MRSEHGRARSPQVPVVSPRFHHQHRAPLTPPQHHTHYQQQQSDQDISMADGSRPLDRLLGCDTDAYVEEHMGKYEQAMNRWRDCSMEEWEAGGDELATRFAKILDFVKDHMITKMKLFKNLDAKVDMHNTVLDERQKMLEGAKARLVHESGNVLGKGSR